MTRLAVARMRGLVVRHGTADPFELAKRETVPVLIRAIPHELATPGFTYPLLGVPTIVIDRTLDDDALRLIVCHELYHALFDSPEMAAYLDACPDVRNQQREQRAWDAAEWLFVMAGVQSQGMDWRVVDQVWDEALAA